MVKYKKGDDWFNKPLTPTMKKFEKETNKNAVRGGKITGQFEYWMYQQNKILKSKPAHIGAWERKSEKPKPKQTEIPWVNKRIEKDILGVLSNKRPQQYKTIFNKLEYTEGLLNRGLKNLIDKQLIKREKKYKPDPSGRGLSRAYTIKYKLVPKPKPDAERFWNILPQPQRRRSMFLSDLGYDEAFQAINKKKQWVDISNQLQEEIKKERNIRVLKEIYNLSSKEFNEIYEEYQGDYFNPEEIENGDYVDFGAYGNLYVVYRRDDRSFWVTDLKSERYNNNAPGWIINIHQARKIIRKG